MFWFNSAWLCAALSRASWTAFGWMSAPKRRLDPGGRAEASPRGIHPEPEHMSKMLNWRVVVEEVFWWVWRNIRGLDLSAVASRAVYSSVSHLFIQKKSMHEINET